MLKDFNRDHPGVSRRLAAILGTEAALERSVQQGTSTWTAIPSLDLALGRLPNGIIDISGPESTGKTGLLYQIVASAQLEGRPALFWATETLDVPYMERVGVDTKNLPVLIGNAAGEDFFDFARSHKDAVLALDSFTALRPRGEKELTDWNDMAWDFVQELRGVIQDGSCVLLSSQVRAKPRSKGTRSASRRFEDLFDTQLELSREEVSDEQYTLVVNIKAHTLTTPHKYRRLPCTKGWGVDRLLDLINAARELEILEARGAWLHFAREEVIDGNLRQLDTTLGNGEHAAKKKLEADDELLDKIEAAVYEQAPGVTE